MTKDEIEKICKACFEEAGEGLDIPEIKPESRIALDLEIDSIHILETMIMIEDELDIALDAEDFQTATTIQELYDLVEQKVRDKDNA